MGVYRKLFAILKETNGIAKDMEIDMGTKGKYYAVSEVQVTKIIRPLLIKYQLIVIPIRATPFQVANGLTTIEYTYRIVDIEMEALADGSFIDVDVIGQGKSTADKGAGMASTYAFKYLWIRLFALLSGEDADNKGDYAHDQETEALIKRYIALEKQVHDLQKGGKLGDNYQRILEAVKKSKDNEKAIAAGEFAMSGILNGTIEPNTVAVK